VDVDRRVVVTQDKSQSNAYKAGVGLEIGTMVFPMVVCRLVSCYYLAANKGYDMKGTDDDRLGSERFWGIRDSMNAPASGLSS
jgi:hypothetical protein